MDKSNSRFVPHSPELPMVSVKANTL
jgi:hypothetical protein